MNAARYQRVKELFHEALGRPPSERGSFLASRAQDPGIAAEVKSLLEVHEASPGFLEGASPGQGALALGGFAGRRLGRWRLVREIGCGGMGVVWEVTRADGEYEQRAAVKLLPLGLLSAADAARFREERRILAALSHPGIARLLDGGTAEDGSPYLVMEYIEGERLDTWCDARKLDVRERLRLFRQVCEAVAYAHREQVLHRDLKPANILVTPDGSPKLLDFGIARMLGSGPARGSTLTRRLLTPEYASPEQVRGQVAGPATDVYSLGVILYRLLTGRHPYPLETADPVQMMTAVCEREPARPRLGGDLDAVVLQCLRKDPAERYASVEALAADLAASLEGRPVSARPWPRWRRAARAGRRHRLLILSGAAVTSLAVALVVSETGRQPAAVPEPHRLTLEAGIYDRPAISPDGRLLVYGHKAPGESHLDLWVQQIDHRPVQLTRGPANDAEPAFSPDGSRIAYVERASTHSEVVILPIRGGEPRRFPEAFAAYPRFAPDGRSVVFNCKDGESIVPCVADLAAGRVRRAGIGGLRLFAAPIFYVGDSAHVLVQNRADMEFYVVPVNGGSPVATGIATAFRRLGAPLTFASDALGSRVFLVVQSEDKSNVWTVALNPRGGRVSGSPRQLTWAAGIVDGPRVSANGTMVFEVGTTIPNARLLPADARAGKVLGPARPVTDDQRPTKHFCGVSADGSSLFFAYLAEGRRIPFIRRDVESGREAVLFEQQVPEAVACAPSPDGAQLAFGEYFPKPTVLKIVSLDGRRRQAVCDGCLMLPWLPDSKGIPYYPVSRRGRVSVFDLHSQRAEDVLWVPDFTLQRFAISHDRRWIAVCGQTAGSASGGCWMVRYRPGSPPPMSQWVPLPGFEVSPAVIQFSPVADVLFFIEGQAASRRALWVRYDRVTGRLHGAPGVIPRPAGLDHWPSGFVQLAANGLYYGAVTGTSEIWWTRLPPL